MEQTLETIDLLVHVVGGLVCLGLLVGLLRGGRWRDPLAGHGWLAPGPRLLHVVLVVLVYLVACRFLAQGVREHFDPASIEDPGSLGWHAYSGVEAAAKLMASAPLVIILAGRRPFAPGPRRRLVRPGLLGVGLVAALGLIPLGTVQLQMGSILWRWLQPGAVPPTHAALQALHHSQWGGRGTAQLFMLTLAVAPVTEELFFRGLLLGALWNVARRVWPAIALSALAFGLMHIGQPQGVLPLVTMGLVLGYVRVRYRSLVPCVLAHLLFNARTMVMLYLAPELLSSGR